MGYTDFFFSYMREKSFKICKRDDLVENMDKKDKYFMYNIKCIFVTVINADKVKYSINQQL